MKTARKSRAATQHALRGLLPSLSLGWAAATDGESLEETAPAQTELDCCTVSRRWKLSTDRHEGTRRKAARDRDEGPEDGS